jgi:hypothetical protein
MPATIGRRELIAAFGGAAAAWPLAARAQQAHGLITLPAPGSWRPEERKRADVVMSPKR